MMTYPYTPPFIAPGSVPVPMGIPDNSGGGPPLTGSSPSPPGMYQQGPFCFGLDTSLCSMLPSLTQGTCKWIANVICALGVVLILVVILGIALYGLVGPG